MSALGHSRRSDGQEGFAECPLCLQWRPNLCVVTNRRDVPDSDIRTLIGTAGKKTPPTPVLASFDVPFQRAHAVGASTVVRKGCNCPISSGDCVFTSQRK
jgi:hypothetical protein